MKVHVITPFSRPQNLPVLIAHLEEEKIDTWYPVYFNGQFPGSDKSWIVPVLIDKAPEGRDTGTDICAYKLNWAIEHIDIVDDDYYCFLTDTLYEKGFFDKLRGVDHDVAVCSMKRGQHTPDDNYNGFHHETSTLFASYENMQPGRIGPEQMIVKGRVLKQVRFSRSFTFDGDMGITLRDGFNVHFEPEWYALFNYLQPGRWDK